MKKLCLFLILLSDSIYSFSQYTIDSISRLEIKSIISYLSSDSLKGRGNYTVELNKAAHFIADKFAESGLEYFPGVASYLLPFTYKKLSNNQRLIDSSGQYDPHYILQNVVGVVPGKSLAADIIIFSAHYDHIGVGKADLKGDSIFNGANDNASGTTALLMLADYFSKRKDNNRTLIFCAFAGEELGNLGSSIFADYLKPSYIKAVINIEMIGKNNYTGKKNTFFITGSEYSNFNRIFTKALKGSTVKIINEPDQSKQLFQRSDNFTFALKGIPAHTIMASDDGESCYHKPCDDISRIDIDKMTEIIKAIAVGCKTIVNGKDTPSRIYGLK